MRRFLVTTLYSGLPFGVVMALLAWPMAGFSVGVPLGLVAGLVFGVAMAAFAAVSRRRFQTERPDFAGETLLREGPANHFFHAESVGGWLYLTSRRLLFRSHQVNVQPHKLDLPLAEIAEASPAMTLGVIPNGLLIRTVAGGRERFVVEQRRRWSADIAKAKAASG